MVSLASFLPLYMHSCHGLYGLSVSFGFLSFATIEALQVWVESVRKCFNEKLPGAVNADILYELQAQVILVDFLICCFIAFMFGCLSFCFSVSDVGA